jgi:crotonobetainyl-CoA:carnitine CoA-transferase CaiB-like acyl-CoA transferase
MPATVIGDLAAAERGVSTALALLLARQRDGRGRYVEVGIVESAHDFAAPLHHGLTCDTGMLGGALPTYRLYRASDGWVALAALEEHFVEKLRALLEIERIDGDSIGAALGRRTAQEWEGLAQAHDVPLAKVHEPLLRKES